MTINIPTTTKGYMSAWKSTQDGEAGYTVSLGTTQVFVTEANADELARYFLFSEAPSPDPEPEPEPEA